MFTHTFGGASGSDLATAGALDAQGNVIAVGTTNSPDFPVVHAFRPTLTRLPLLQSPDGKSSINANLAGAIDVTAMASSADGAVLYAASSSGTFRSSDGGLTWIQQLPGLGGASTLAVDAGDPNILYAGITGNPFGGTLHKSVDGGKNWISLPTVNGFFTVKNVQAAAVSSTVYHMENALFRSRDGGNTWIALAPNKLYIFTYALATSNAAVLYAVASDGLLYRSGDAGDTWTAAGPKFGAAGTQDPQVVSMAVDPRNEKTVWLLAGANLYRSTDGGATVQPVLSVPQDAPRWVSVSPTAGRLMVGGNGSALASIDGGSTWQRFASGSYFNTIFAGKTAFYVGGSASTDIFVTKWSADGSHILFSTFLGPGFAPLAATDSNGNIYVTGIAYSGFPFTSGQLDPHGLSLFLAKFDASGNLQFSEAFGPQSARGIALDPAGNVYIAAMDESVVIDADPCSSQSSNPTVIKLDALGRTIFSRVVAETCAGFPSGIAADATGTVYLVGETSSPKLATTPTAIQPLPPGSTFTSGFLARLSPDGRQVTYLTYLGGTPIPGGAVLHPSASAYGVAVDRVGAVFVTGTSNGFPPPISPSAVFGTQGNCGPPEGAQPGYVMKIDLSTPVPVWLTEIAGNCWGVAGAALAIDSKGHVFVGGQTSSGDFPLVAPVEAQGINTGFVSELSSDGKQLLFSSYSSGHLVAESSGDFAIVGVRTPNPNKLNTAISGSDPTYALVEKLDVTATRTAVIDTIGKQEAFHSSYYDTRLLGIAPGQMVRITGRGLGPKSAVGAQLDVSGRVASSLSGTRVLFNAVPAPLISVQDSVVLCMTPFEVGGQTSTSVQIERNGDPAPGVLIGVVPAAIEPDVLAVANQDASANSASNPSRWGQAMTLYITGAGDTVPSVPDGSIYQAPLSRPPVTAFRCFLKNGFSCGLEYVGAAPGMVAGIWQINVRLPASNPGTNSSPIMLTVNGFGTIGAYVSNAQAEVWIDP